MSVTAGTVWRPQVGRGSRVRVVSVTGSTATVVPWPQRGKSRLTPTRVRLAADGSTLVGYVATGQKA